MKKLLTKIVSLTVALVTACFVLNGCGLVTTNEERDMAQVIATVSIDEDLSTDIYKRELASAFNTQGAYYVEYQGYTVQEAYELMLEEIIKSEILVQQAKLALTGATNVIGNETGYFAQAAAAVANGSTASKDKFLTTPNYDGVAMTTLTKTDPIESFTTAYERLVSRFNVMYTVSQLLDGYKDEEEEHNHEYEKFTGTARATLAQEEEGEYNEYEMRYDAELSKVNVQSSFYKSHEQINKKFDLGLNLTTYTNKYDLAVAVYTKFLSDFKIESRDDKRAANKLIKDLKDLGFITSAEATKTPANPDDFLALTYFEDVYKSQIQNVLVAKYELALTNQQEKKLGDNNELYNAYLNIFNSQKAIYDNDYSAYETALEQSNDTSLVFYNPDFGGKYGQVLNLLIGFSEEQTAIFNEYKSSGNRSDGDLIAKRNELLTTLVAKDQRSSWVESNYGKYENNAFTFKNTYVKTEELNKFIGTFYGAKEYEYHDEYDEHATAYTFDAIKSTKLTFNEFFYGKSGVFSGVSNIMGFTSFSGELTGVSEQNELGTQLKKETLDKYLDIIYAFSTDGGSLSEGYGYLYSPKTSKDKYVSEYAEASARLINKGVGAYEVVATEYGYHVMLCAKVIEPTASAITPGDFETLLTQKDSIPYIFKEYQKSRIVADNINKITSVFINENIETGVTYFEDTYKDLLEA